ncbi:MAG: hypothetical protein ACREF3_18085, partial [Acetobacteraceae bacterium]
MSDAEPPDFLSGGVGTNLSTARLRHEAAERRRAEQVTLDGEERLRAALVASDTGTFRWNPCSGEFLE